MFLTVYASRALTCSVQLMCRTSDTHCLVEKIKSSLDQLQVSCEPLGIYSVCIMLSLVLSYYLFQGDSTKRKVADAGGGGVSEVGGSWGGTEIHYAWSLAWNYCIS